MNEELNRMVFELKSRRVTTMRSPEQNDYAVETNNFESDHSPTVQVWYALNRELGIDESTEPDAITIDSINTIEGYFIVFRLEWSMWDRLCR